MYLNVLGQENVVGSFVLNPAPRTKDAGQGAHSLVYLHCEGNE